MPRHSLPAAALVVLVACGGSDGPTKPIDDAPACAVAAIPATAPLEVPAASPFDALFADAGAEFRVPAQVLRGIGFVETRWQMVQGVEEFDGVPTASGVMALRGDRLAAGARLARVSDASAMHDPRSNIRAAAALLRSIADARGVSGNTLEGWEGVLAEYSGIARSQGRAAYVADVREAVTGQRVPEAGSTREPCAAPPAAPSPIVDHAGSLWRASPNFNTRMSGEGGRIHMVIIHSCEGGYAGCWSWLADVNSQVSAHYVVREDGAEVTQLVREAGRAWHIGATYDASLNAGHDAHLQGVQSNHFTIGVEHAGYASQATWPSAQLDASAKLVCGMTKRWGIPRDKLHIVSHGQLQPYNRTDPGKNWPWEDYLARVDKACST